MAETSAHVEVQQRRIQMETTVADAAALLRLTSRVAIAAVILADRCQQANELHPFGAPAHAAARMTALRLFLSDPHLAALRGRSS